MVKSVRKKVKELKNLNFTRKKIQGNGKKRELKMRGYQFGKIRSSDYVLNLKFNLNLREDQ